MTLASRPGCNAIIMSCSSAVWDDVPTELYFYIFKRLDITSLRCCLSVSRKWREIALYICEEQDLWQALAKDGMVNHGLVQRLKSTLSWKDLYFNSFLWDNVPSATGNGVYEKAQITSMHICKGELIVKSGDRFENYKVETLQFAGLRLVGNSECVDFEESDDLLMIVTDDLNDLNYKVKVTALSVFKGEVVDDRDSYYMPHTESPYSTHVVEKSRCWRFVGDRVYIIDSRFVLWECSAIDKLLYVKAIARFYGDYVLPIRNSCNPIHVLEKEVYISEKMGSLVMVNKNNRMFQKVDKMQIPTIVIESNLKTIIPNTGDTHKFNAFVKFPFAVKFKDGCKAPLNMIHYQYHDPTMTSSLQHGDLVFRGFFDGKIMIHSLRNGAKLILNVQQFDDKKVECPAVTAMEILELKDKHKLFVATDKKLYIILLKYPKRSS